VSKVFTSTPLVWDSSTRLDRSDAELELEEVAADELPADAEADAELELEEAAAADAEADDELLLAVLR
jgi:hypothetical protein